jgi:hypothetical protein
MQASEQVERHLTANMNISKKDILLGNFLGGLAWGVGSVVGAGIIVAAVGVALNALGVFAAIGNMFSGLGTAAEQLQKLPQVPNLYR